MNIVWHHISETDKFIQENKPFEVIKNDEQKGKDLIVECVKRLWKIQKMIIPLLPETAKEIEKNLRLNKKPEKPLFLRVD